MPPPTVSALPAALPEALRDNPRIGELELLAAMVLSSADPEFGGLSALLVEGLDLRALSDRAVMWQADARFADDGTLTGLERWRKTPIGDPEVDDTEAIARLADGSLIAASETPFELIVLGGQLPAGASALTGALADLPDNRGVEAMTSLPDGGLLVLVEAADEDGTHAALTLRNGSLVRGRYRAAGGYSPVGADRVGDDVFVLERRFSLLNGFQARLTRLGAGLDGRELARLGTGNVSENFEGIAATRARDGSVLLYLVSDDNFSPLQRTLLLQLRWRPGAP